MAALALSKRVANAYTQKKLLKRGVKMGRDMPTYISLTGEKSHKISVPVGQGSFSIGTTGLSEGKYDVWVDDDKSINWSAFNGLYTGHGSANAEQHPCGDWPRWFYYSGSDKGFLEWSCKRHIEHFNLFTYEDASIDLTKANIYGFSLHVYKGKVNISIGSKTKVLSLSGNIEDIDIKKCDTFPYLRFKPRGRLDENGQYQLPLYKLLENAPIVDIDIPPIGIPFDCKSLLQFANLKNLSLSGNLTNVDVLAELKHLEAIALRYVPDLTNVPNLSAWVNLKSFIGWNIEETAGKVLKKELNELAKTKELEHSSVSQLRKKIWFTTEYGIPFSAWEGKSEKTATKAYKTCLKEIKKAKTENEVHKAIIDFVKVINSLPNIETTEREDAGTAVLQLIESSVLEISEETGIKWFDEVRDF